MKVYIKNKIITIGGSSTVVDENGQTVFTVKGKWPSITNKKFLYDKDDKLLYIIRNKYWRMFNRYALIYDADKNLIAKVQSKFFSIKKYTILNHKNEIVINGKIFSNSSIVRNGDVIGTYSRRPDMLRDSFELDAKEEDLPFLTALIIGIDNITDSRTKDRN